MKLRIGSYLLSILIAVPFNSNAELKLGPLTFADAIAKHLDVRTHISDGIASLHFINKVGGIAFDGVAVGMKNDSIVSVQFDYNIRRSDGDRLHIIFTNSKQFDDTVSALIYDWQLIPIALYANTNSYACATSQGELEDSVLQQRHTMRGDWILNYHPAFEKTLLGTRIVQADFLTILPEACDLPKKDGQYVLGEGESSPQVDKNRKTWEAFQGATRKIQQEDYFGYVICDYETPILFSVVKGKLVLTGDPIWCYIRCEKSVMDSVEALIHKEVMSRKQELQEKIGGVRATKDPQINARVYKMLLKEYTDTYLEKRRAEIVDALPQSIRPYVLKKYSTTLTELIRRHRNMNIQVYNALTTTMRYAAFFRWANHISPTSFQNLINSFSPADNTFITPSILVVSE